MHRHQPSNALFQSGHLGQLFRLLAIVIAIFGAVVLAQRQADAQSFREGPSLVISENAPWRGASTVRFLGLVFDLSADLREGDYDAALTHFAPDYLDEARGFAPGGTEELLAYVMSTTPSPFDGAPAVFIDVTGITYHETFLEAEIALERSETGTPYTGILIYEFDRKHLTGPVG